MCSAMTPPVSLYFCPVLPSGCLTVLCVILSLPYPFPSSSFAPAILSLLVRSFLLFTAHLHQYFLLLPLAPCFSLASCALPRETGIFSSLSCNPILLSSLFSFPFFVSPDDVILTSSSFSAVFLYLLLHPHNAPSSSSPSPLSGIAFSACLLLCHSVQTFLRLWARQEKNRQHYLRTSPQPNGFLI